MGISRPAIPAKRHERAQGFTLVELMVVIAIMGLAVTMVVLTMPGDQNRLNDEVDRFAARLSAARDIAVVEGHVTAVNLATSGYSFERRIDGAWQPLPGRAFASHPWPGGVAFIDGRDKGAVRVLFDTVGASPTPQAIVLQGVGARAKIRISATGEISRE